MYDYFGNIESGRWGETPEGIPVYVIDDAADEAPTPSLCGCKACGGAEARALALAEAEAQRFLSHLGFLRHLLNPDGALAHRNPTLESARAESWDGTRDAYDAESAYFVERTAA